MTLAGCAQPSCSPSAHEIWTRCRSGRCWVREGEVLGEGWNCPLTPARSKRARGGRGLARGRESRRQLPGAALYVTLEPCVMCAGAILHARLARVVFGALDPKGGAAGSVFAVLGTECLHHRVEVQGGCLGEACGEVLQLFFQSRRDPARPSGLRTGGLRTVLYTLAEVLGRALSARGYKLVTAESCTGGWLAQAITAVPGSSGWFERGFVVYSQRCRFYLGSYVETGQVAVHAVRRLYISALRQYRLRWPFLAERWVKQLRSIDRDRVLDAFQNTFVSGVPFKV
jgi:tRNA(adenine34) deaminase